MKLAGFGHRDGPWGARRDAGLEPRGVRHSFAFMPQTNRQVRLAARPSGLPRRTDWEFSSEPVPALGAGEFVVAISHLSVDPAMRGWMSAAPSYVPPVKIGAVMRG